MDDGEYQCQAPGEEGGHGRLRSPTARVTVLAPPNDPYIAGGTLQKVIENRPVRLKCIAGGGKPAAEVLVL
jgi:hypothetical protein